MPLMDFYKPVRFNPSVLFVFGHKAAFLSRLNRGLFWLYPVILFEKRISSAQSGINETPKMGSGAPLKNKSSRCYCSSFQGLAG
jgi:hypothetical protein